MAPGRRKRPRPTGTATMYRSSTWIPSNNGDRPTMRIGVDALLGPLRLHRAVWHLETPGIQHCSRNNGIRCASPPSLLPTVPLALRPLPPIPWHPCRLNLHGEVHLSFLIAACIMANYDCPNFLWLMAARPWLRQEGNKGRGERAGVKMSKGCVRGRRSEIRLNLLRTWKVNSTVIGCVRM